MAAWLSEKVADAVDGWLLPAMPLGNTSANDGFPGTVSLSFDTVRAIATDVGRSLARSGFPCLIIVNGDWGNRAALGQASRDLAVGGWPVLVVDYPGLAEVASAVCETPAAGAGFYHADEVETSVVLALHPELVHMERAVASYPLMPATLGSTPTDLARLSPSGVFGDPRTAAATKGRAILDALADRAIGLARSFLSDVAAMGDGDPTAVPPPAP
jgi:creatinine amidohydrolase